MSLIFADNIAEPNPTALILEHDQRDVLLRCARELQEALTTVEKAKLCAVSVQGLNMLALQAAAMNTRISALTAEAEGAYVKLHGDLFEELTRPNLSGTTLRATPAIARADKELRAEKAIVNRLKSSHSDLRDLIRTIRYEARVLESDRMAPKFDELPSSVYATGAS
jgi:hypothetical protein